MLCCTNDQIYDGACLWKKFSVYKDMFDRNQASICHLGARHEYIHIYVNISCRCVCIYVFVCVCVCMCT
jgi:hypothetical protein